ncbi:hypothetical protein MRY87_08120 [bacterium]|nr:hypothetical protein [bacterium]
MSVTGEEAAREQTRRSSGAVVVSSSVVPSSVVVEGGAASDQSSFGLSYQSLRHLVPSHRLHRRTAQQQEQARNQLSSLKQVNRRSPLQPPFVHRPDSRYLSSFREFSEG